MKSALHLGERIVQSSAMAVPDEFIADVTLGLAFGTLTLTDQRLVFEPDLLSVRAKSGNISLSEIVAQRLVGQKFYISSLFGRRLS